MNKIFTGLILLVLLINYQFVNKVEEEIKNKRKEIQQMKRKAIEYDYINENKKVQKLLKNNKISKEYTFTESAKEVISYFKSDGVTIQAANFEKTGINQVAIKIEIIGNIKEIQSILQKLKVREKLITVEKAEFKRLGKKSLFKWTIDIKRYFNI